MSEQDAGVSTVSETNRGPGFPQNLFNLYFGPTEAFTAILKKPSFWAPLLAFVVLQLAFTWVWMGRIDVIEFLKIQAENAGQPFQEPPGSAVGFIRGMFWMSAVVFTPLMILIVAGVYLFVFRFFLASEVNFKQAMTVVAYSFLAVALVHTPLILLTMHLKGDWNLDPRTVVAANATLLLDKTTTPKPLYVLAGAIDGFFLWTLWLVAAGFGVASRRTTGAALPGVFVPWGILVLCMVGWAALF
jgi:Yip1-like protein